MRFWAASALCLFAVEWSATPRPKQDLCSARTLVLFAFHFSVCGFVDSSSTSYASRAPSFVYPRSFQSLCACNNNKYLLKESLTVIWKCANEARWERESERKAAITFISLFLDFNRKSLRLRSRLLWLCSSRTCFTCFVCALSSSELRRDFVRRLLWRLR